MTSTATNINTKQTDPATSIDQNQLQHFTPGQIKPDPEQPRKHFDKKALNELANDIKVRGIIEPIIFRIDNKGTKLITAGERRWRAAKIAGLKTVPCLLRNNSTAIEVLFDQVSENFQREDLNPMEMAQFFDALVTKHDIKLKDVSATIEKHGLKKFARSYISNIRRLLQLPAWAQDLIATGKLPAAHGKQLLEGIGSEKVMDQLKVFLEKPSDDEEPITGSDISYEVRDAFGEFHKKLDKTWGDDATLFDYEKQCKGCNKRKAFKQNNFYSANYCLDDECFAEKNAEGLKKQQAAEKAAATREKNKLKKQAEKMGVSLDELEATNEAIATPLGDPRKGGRVERTQEHLDEWLRQQLRTHLVEDDATRYMVVLWMAAGSPGMYGYPAAGHVDLESRQDDLFGKIDIDDNGIDLMLKQLAPQYDFEYAVFTSALNHMTRRNLRKLAHHCGIVLEGNYYIDADYLNIKLKDEIIEATPQAAIDAFDDWAKACKLPKPELVERLVAREVQFGVPADLIAMYNNIGE